MELDTLSKIILSVNIPLNQIPSSCVPPQSKYISFLISLGGCALCHTLLYVLQFHEYLIVNLCSNIREQE